MAVERELGPSNQTCALLGRLLDQLFEMPEIGIDAAKDTLGCHDGYFQRWAHLAKNQMRSSDR